MDYREEERKERNILSISDRNSGLPIRLQRLSALPWYDCWVQQLRIEKKSKHTIRAHCPPRRSVKPAFPVRMRDVGTIFLRFL